jgi:hypothetical protein
MDPGAAVPLLVALILYLDPHLERSMPLLSGTLPEL